MTKDGSSRAVAFSDVNGFVLSSELRFINPERIA